MPDRVLPASLPDGVDERAVYRSLFMANPDALLLVDQRGSVVLANPPAAALLGYEAWELAGLSVEALVPSNIRPRHAAYREAYAQAPRTRPMGHQTDLVALRKDGTEVQVEIALSPLQTHGLPFVVAAIRDVSAYPRVKQALRRARYGEHLAQLGREAVDTRDPHLLLEQAPRLAAQALEVETALIYLLDADRQHLRVAGGAGLLAEGEGLGARMPNRPDTPAGFVLAEGRPVRVEDYRQEQRFAVPPAYLAAGWVSAMAVPLMDRGRPVGAFTVRSRSAQRFGDEEQRFLESVCNLLATSLQRAQSEEQLQHAQKLESVGQLTGGIAHDFNNLLTVIGGNLQVLEDWPALAADPQVQQYVAAATRATRRAAELTGKLLAFARRQVLQPTRVDLGAMLHSLADMLGRTLDQRIRIETEAAPGCTVQADPGQLEAALLNIAINARDAMPEGGVLRFAAAPVDRLPTALHSELGDPSARQEHFVAIAIADTGSGMPEAVKERAFEPFFTTKGAGRGTGLGLSTVYGFVKQSRGAVAIDSAPGEGTTVTLYIPRPWAGDAAAEPAGAVASGVPPGLKVLLVEDDTEVRKVVERFLGDLGCEVSAVPSAEQALLALGPQARFDLLLSDIALGPGLRGTELAAEAQRRFPALAILLMSGFSAELLEADRDAPPQWELLRKPYTRAELAQAIGRLVGAGAPGAGG